MSDAFHYFRTGPYICGRHAQSEASRLVAVCPGRRVASRRSGADAGAQLVSGLRRRGVGAKAILVVAGPGSRSLRRDA
jgi:hypothetical protein